MEHICPFCGKKYKRLSSHYYNCKELNNLSKEEVKIKYLKFRTNNDNILEDIKNEYLNNKSLTDIKEKYNLDLKSICWCLSYQKIHIRSVSESYNIITKQKIINTSQKKWGVDNPSQAQEIKDKKSATFIKHYGVDNIWKTKEYAEFTSKRWASYSNEKKSELIHKWTHQDGRISKLENKIISILNDLNIPIETQFKFNKYFHKYDIHILNTNILLEINGDFWHANPKLYKSDDELNFPRKNKIKALDIWNKDKKNIEYAISENYIVIQLWESDIYEYEKQNKLEIFVVDNLNKYMK
jgi:hypothetical protein